MNLPNFGVGLGPGGVRIGAGGGDFSPGKLIGVITTGQGFEKPRLMGGLMLGLAVLFIGGNTALVLVLHRYYPYLYSLAAIFWWTGLWLVITGQPRAQPDGKAAPIWSRAGMGVALVIGVLMGVALIVFNWEAALFSE